jgi:hypothetical protein
MSPDLTQVCDDCGADTNTECSWNCSTNWTQA